MGIFIKNLYRERNGESKTKVSEVFNKSVLDRLFRLMGMYFSFHYKDLLTDKNYNVLSPFLERLYFHLSDEKPEESKVKDGFPQYCEFVRTTTLDKFFESLELFCFQIYQGLEYLRNYNRQRNDGELLDFLDNANELFFRNPIPYRLQVNKSNKRILVVKISESEAVEEVIEEFVRLTSDKRFQKCQEKFIEAENCFAKNDFDGVMIKCNSMMEEMLCIILGKGSGTISNLIEDFLKKFDLPREFSRALKKFPEIIQHARSTYPEDIHGKNEGESPQSSINIKEELAEYILGETAGFGRFIIKAYPMLNK